MINTMDIQRTGLSEELIKEISTIASKWGVQKVILFGSRSRGDYGRASDIDLAVSGGDFTQFCLNIEENAWTLLKFDIINLDDPLEPDFRAMIQKEGVTLYEKI
ncbi:nucleotidyltransferase family protein [Megasphaera sp. AM44-1BH]|jgi:predicted nucleotidyltransferase|uniref:nucleotidyltransferase family protein n=1 Tax=Megasphaera sp. AM44-1BH TaxID=2292358 RepID=UPI000E4D12E1|nr:nucleotidyltransferase domain-containing protein [Megasphaera sp. AM44-1BH]RHA09738.1 nucleotidyltransferase domain-containing protein [Megasphaera sp. AM44-1BH]